MGNHDSVGRIWEGELGGMIIRCVSMEQVGLGWIIGKVKEWMVCVCEEEHKRGVNGGGG